MHLPVYKINQAEEEDMCKNKDFFRPHEIVEERERKYLFSEKCNGAIVQQSRWSAHCVHASSAPTRVKPFQKTFYLNLFPAREKHLLPQRCPSVPVLPFLPCLEKSWKVDRIDHSAHTSQAKILFMGIFVLDRDRSWTYAAPHWISTCYCH